MDISGVGSSTAQNSAQTSSKDVEEQIKELEQKKVKLEQELEKQDSPFATKQSADYNSTKKKIEKLEKQIEQLKSNSNTRSENSAGVSTALEGLSNAEQTDALSQVRQFDEFIRSEDLEAQLSAGIYTVTNDENGNPKISIDQPSELYNLAKEDPTKDDARSENLLEKETIQ